MNTNPGIPKAAVTGTLPAPLLKEFLQAPGLKECFSSSSKRNWLHRCSAQPHADFGRSFWWVGGCLCTACNHTTLHMGNRGFLPWDWLPQSFSFLSFSYSFSVVFCLAGKVWFLFFFFFPDKLSQDVSNPRRKPRERPGDTQCTMSFQVSHLILSQNHSWYMSCLAFFHTLCLTYCACKVFNSSLLQNREYENE